MRISNIVAHHSGGLGTNQYASTLFITPYSIAAHHKNKWNFASKYIIHPVLKYGGYNVTYDPKTRIFTQHRAIGEETAAQRGHNEDTFSLCVIGNYNTKHKYQQPKSSRKSVDPMTEQVEKDVADFLHDLINGNKRNLIVAPNTTMNFSIKRIYAHRFFSWTTCYGSFLADNWAQELVIQWKKTTPSEKIAAVKKRLALMQTILRLYAIIGDLLNKMKLQKQSLGAVGDRECDGLINL